MRKEHQQCVRFGDANGLKRGVVWFGKVKLRDRLNRVVRPCGAPTGVWKLGILCFVRLQKENAELIQGKELPEGTRRRGDAAGAFAACTLHVLGDLDGIVMKQRFLISSCLYSLELNLVN